MASYIVGITGGIGSGKSAVSDRFAQLGIVIADADVASREIVEPGQPAFEAIADRFGESILQTDGTLDRAKLRSIVFADIAERKWLEGQTHRRIMARLGETIAKATSPYAMLVLSAGTGQSPLMKRMLVVDAPEALQIARVTSRDGNDETQVRAIMASQPSRETRLEIADDVITNDGDLARLDLEVEKLHQFYLQEALNHG